MADIPPINPGAPTGAVPPKKETGKVQPKKETVRINLPPKPIRRADHQIADAAARRSDRSAERNADRHRAQAAPQQLPLRQSRTSASRAGNSTRRASGCVRDQWFGWNSRHCRRHCRAARHRHDSMDGDDSKRRDKSVIWFQNFFCLTYVFSVNRHTHAGKFCPASSAIARARARGFLGGMVRSLQNDCAVARRTGRRIRRQD